MFGLAGAAHAAPELGGRPFSPPGDEVVMPDGWDKKKIQRPDGADLALAIDQQLYPALLPLVQAFSRQTGLKVAIQEGTCGVAAGALSERSADITGMCCPPGPLDRLPGVRYHTIGISAIALIVHPANPLTDVTMDQARRLFGGQTRSWADLPVSGMVAGPASDVRAVTRLHCKPRPGHWRLLLDNENQFSQEMHEVPAIRDMIAEVARSRTAIGYETLWHIADNARLGVVKPLKLNGLDPADRKSLAQGRYPLYRVMNITSWSGTAADPRAAKLAAWLVDNAPTLDPAFAIVPAQELRSRGWSFDGDEIVAPPK
ncbi:substrate-binding domain-containing protein [Magnetospirillum moscoviense]|uniref:PBP domain-containing protein n=1 Tax=Magnetospirillum moscoviense TaxID=1437059 RepID=A0A178MEA9_9PROT|nr:substrate-binding domain-containing protein [Magnetospirillum moscoviense]MBF0323694.1 hypothetical protein [Alphaproteobacteria bacterium]OAN46368.1 hypothetical protein A6A05_03850 [Magnetospirillum moscoviense]